MSKGLDRGFLGGAGASPRRGRGVREGWLVGAWDFWRLEQDGINCLREKVGYS